MCDTENERKGACRFMEIQTTVNGQLWQGSVPVEETLLEFLRHRLGLTGTKRSCELQICGACTVMVNEMPVSSCTYLAVRVQQRSVVSVEGLFVNGKPDALQTAFVRNTAFQCGYCTPGMLIACRSLLNNNPRPTHDGVSEWLEGNICRCGCYSAIIKSVLEVAKAE